MRRRKKPLDTGGYQKELPKNGPTRSRSRLVGAARAGSTVAKRRLKTIAAERARRKARGGKTRRQVAEEMLGRKKRRPAK